ncbi:MAG: pyrroline-5-carboxylate reductase [Burkholderiales bacterium]|nr:pyrroline-5-carboxylate reductase [Burkholderiales bacterium]
MPVPHFADEHGGPLSITFIGGGNMATALVGGLLARGTPAASIGVVEPLHEARARLSERYGVACFESAAQADPLGDLVVLAVKPQQAREACRALRPHVGDRAVLSVAAGIRIEDISRWVGGTSRIARCMPNTPALIGAGISGVFARAEVDAAARGQIQSILEAVGKVVWVAEEALLDPVTAVSASGPAYVFYFIEALEQAADEMGLPADAGAALAIETFRGAAELAARSSEPAATLRGRVTSKGGTTERALASMHSDGVKEAIVRALHAANRRARELGDEFGKDD